MTKMTRSGLFLSLLSDSQEPSCAFFLEKMAGNPERNSLEIRTFCSRKARIVDFPWPRTLYYLSDNFGRSFRDPFLRLRIVRLQRARITLPLEFKQERESGVIVKDRARWE